MTFRFKYDSYMPPDSFFIFPKGLPQAEREMRALPADRFAALPHAVVFFKDGVPERLKQRFLRDYESLQQHKEPNGFESTAPSPRPGQEGRGGTPPGRRGRSRARGKGRACASADGVAREAAMHRLERAVIHVREEDTNNDDAEAGERSYPPSSEMYQE